MMEVFTPLQTLRGTTEEKLAQVRSFLFQLVDKLNRAVVDLDDNIVQTTQTVKNTVSAEAAKTASTNAANLKALIIQNADEVQREIDSITTNLTANYVARSELYGTYTENINTAITQSAEAVTQAIETGTTITTIQDAIGALQQYESNMSGYIKSGIVDWDGITPIIGIAIGQNLEYTSTTEEVDGTVYTEIDKKSFSSVFTATELAFYQGDQKVAYLKNDRLYITDAIFTGTVHHGDKWEVSHTNGYTLKWIGG